jgi:hypothetical protein
MPRKRLEFEQFVHLGENPPAEICYLYHLDPPYIPEGAEDEPSKWAGHYIGTRNIDSDRDDQHGTSSGARLLEVQREAGGTWHLVRTWAGGRDKERQLKTRAGSQYCPECAEHPIPGTRPRKPGAKYLTRKQRREAQWARETRERDPYANMQMREMTYAEVQAMLGRRRELLGTEKEQRGPELSDEEQLRLVEQLEATWSKAAPQYELEAG